MHRTARAIAEREAQVAARVGEAEIALGAIEKTFGELTGALADLVARRNQLERAVSEHSVRLVRLEGQIGEVETELASLDRARERRAGRRSRSPALPKPRRTP